MEKSEKQEEFSVSGRDVMRTIRAYNNIVDALGSKKFKKLSDDYGIAKRSRFFRNFQYLTYVMLEEKLDIISYISLTIRKLLNTYKDGSKKIYPSYITSRKMINRYLDSYAPKVIEQKELSDKELKEKSKWTNWYIDSIKRKMKNNWGSKYELILNSYQFKEWEATVRSQVTLFEGE